MGAGVALSWLLAAFAPPLAAGPDLRPAAGTWRFRDAGHQQDRPGGPVAPNDLGRLRGLRRCIGLRRRGLKAPGPSLTYTHSGAALLSCAAEALGLPHGCARPLAQAGAFRRFVPRLDSDDRVRLAPAYLILDSTWISYVYFHCLLFPCLSSLPQLPSSAASHRELHLGGQLPAKR